MTAEAFTPELMRSYVRSFASRVSGNFIGGQWVASSADEGLDVHDPSTGQVIGRTTEGSAQDVDTAVRSAATVQAAWARLTPGARSELLYSLADLVEEHAEEFIALECVDVGKPVSAVKDFEFSDIVAGIRYFIGAARVLPAPASMEYLEGVTSVMRREPVGVVGAITPWNYPLLQAMAKVIPALATGNTCVIKPAETTPYSTARFAELAAEVLPAGVLNVVIGRGPISGDALARHPGVGLVSFTGSVETGRKVGMAAADGVKKAVMELGGNSPVLVFDDAAVDDALELISIAGLYNTGQDCMAASRLLVHASIRDRVIEGLAARISKVVVGDSLDGNTTMGPMNSEGQRARVADRLSRMGQHATVVTGGSALEQAGYFFQPTIVTDVRQDDEVVAEEIFGPVFTVQSFETEDEALRLANGTRYGLAASVFTTNLGVATRMQQGLDFGTVWVNNHLIFGADLPVSGFKASGVGVENGQIGILEYTRLKHVMVDPRA